MHRPQSPEYNSKKAALPHPSKIELIKKWIARLKSIPESAMPTLPLEDDDVVAYMEAQKERNEAQAKAAKDQEARKNSNSKKLVGALLSSQDAAGAAPFDWKKVAKFDNAVVIELLNELSAGKEEDHVDADEDELKYGALTRAISRFDERPSQCFGRDILHSMLEVAAESHNILSKSIGPKEKSTTGGNNGDEDAAAGGTVPPPPVQTLLMQGGTNHVMLSKLQCYCIMACSFLGIFPRQSSDCTDLSGQLPSINLSEMYVIATVSSVGPIVNVEKLLMFFEYFAVCSKRYKSKDPRMTSPQFGCIFTRGVTPSTIPQDWGHDVFRNAPMQDLHVMNLRESIDDQKTTLRVDFANAIIGGAALSYGCVQEEIMFAECPEMNCSRWLCPVMRSEEAVLILRCEQFAKHAGYAHSLVYQGPHRDADGDMLASAVIAVDALDFRSISSAVQFGEKGIRREFNKLCAALDACAVAEAVYGVELPTTICTGNWGCGVFRGDPELKALIQWLVFSIHGMKTRYCPFDNAPLLSRLRDMSICVAAQKEKVTAAQVGGFLQTLGAHFSPGQSVIAAFAAHFKLDLSMAGESLHRPPQRRDG